MSKQKHEMKDQEQIGCNEDAMQLERLLAIMHRLRSPGGCPWDAEQTHESLVGNLIEETYEVVDTIRRGDMQHMKEELGDLLLQVVFHSELAEEKGEFSFDDVARGVSDKLVRRHPHVYGSSSVEGADGVLTQWDEIKKQEKGGVETSGYLEKVGEELPAILRAAKLQKKAGKVGFDWPNAAVVIEKIDEELDEVKEEMKVHVEGGEVSESVKDEIGDLLFSVVNLARKLKLNPEELIDRTNQKFVNRFHQMESSLKQQGMELKEADLEQMENEWVRAKVHD